MFCFLCGVTHANLLAAEQWLCGHTDMYEKAAAICFSVICTYFLLLVNNLKLLCINVSTVFDCTVELSTVKKCVFCNSVLL
jgi:hypothetical protein